VGRPAPQIQDRKFQTATFRQEIISGRKSHKGARYQDILTVSRKVTSTSPTLYNLYINYIAQTTGVNPAFFADDISVYAAERKDGCVLRKLQRGLNSMATWCKNWTIKNQWRRAIYFSHRISPPELLLTLNGNKIHFVNSIQNLGVILDKKIIWKLNIETVATKAYRTLIRLYSLFKSDRLSTNSKLTLHKTLIRSIITYACPAWEFAADTHIIKLSACNQGSPHYLQIFKEHTDSWYAYILSNSIVYDYITNLCRQQAQVIQRHENVNVRNNGQGAARHRDLNLAVVRHVIVQVVKLVLQT
jgi:hypothetical protein